MLRQTLPNGLGLLVHRNPSAAAVAIQVWVRVGSADEQEGQLGLAHVHEHMLFKGTARRGVGQVAAEIEAAGGEINAYTSFDQTVYHAVLSGRFFETGLDILADAVTASAFDPEELARELEVVVEEIRRGDDTPSRVASKAFFQTAYTQHPYGRPVIGSEASVRSFTREGILAFYRRWYTAKNIVVVAVGDLDEAAAALSIERAFGGMPSGEPGPDRAPEPPWTGLRFQRTPSRFAQALVHVGFPIPADGHPDVAALDVLALILGQGDSSRLERVVRREKGLVNGIGASAYTPRDAGVFMVSANLPPGDARAALEASFAEVWALSRERVHPTELDKAKTLFASQQVYEKESVGGQARKLGYYELLGGGVEREALFLAEVQALTPERLREVAARWLTPESVLVTVLASAAADDGLDADTVAACLAAPAAPSHLPGVALPARGVPPARAPSLTRFTLGSGARLVVAADPTLPLVAVRAIAHGGLGREPLGGSTRLLSQLLMRGTARRSGTAFAEAVESMAGLIDASAGRHTLGLRGVFLADRARVGLELFTEVLREPAFLEAELERERALQLEAIRSEVDRPAQRTMRRALAALYGDHAYAASPLGTPESVAEISAADLLALHWRLLDPSQLVFVVAGDVDPEHAAEALDEALTTRSVGATSVSAPAATEAFRVVESGKGEQAHIVLTFPGLTFNDPDRPALDVLTTVLSGQGGRLFLELRDRQSLAYSVSCSSVEAADTGFVTAYIGTAPDKVDRALEGLTSALLATAAHAVSDAELSRSRNHVAGTWEVAHERRTARVASLAVQELFGGVFTDLSGYPAAVRGVSAADVLRVAQRVFDPSRQVTALYDPRGA